MPLLAITKTYKDGDILFAIDLDAICDSVESFLDGPNLDEINIDSNIIDALASTGMILLYGNTTPPTGWLECDGSQVSKTTYAALFRICGTTFNTGGESAGNFRLPAFARKTPMGTGGTQISATAPGIALGNSGGEETHALTTAELPVHTHTDSGHTHPQIADSTSSSGVSAGPPWYSLYFNQSIGGTFTTGAIPTSTNTVPTSNSTGGDVAHNNIQPSLVWCFIIKT